MILNRVASGAMGRAHDALLGLFAVVALLVATNALRLAGTSLSVWGDAVLQTLACVGAIACALVVAFRVTGQARLWRLLIAGAVACWLAAQMVWWWHALVRHSGPPPPPLSTVGYFAFLLLALAALLLLARSGRPATASDWRGRWPGHRVVVVAVDVLVTTASFALLVWSGDSVAVAGLQIPASGGRPESLAFPLIGSVVMVVAAVLAIAYGADRKYRSNLLLLAAGVMMMLTSDRLIAYLTRVGLEDSGKLWVRAGFVLGPLLIGYAALQFGRERSGDDERGEQLMAWSRHLPYVGAVGVSMLIGLHTYLGQRVDLVQVLLGVAVMTLLVTRQVVEMRENRRLLSKVMTGQHRLIHQLHHDPLTGLPNRLLFAEKLNGALTERAPFVLIYLDVDDFKDVNDQYGHAAGDRLLQAVGQRLRGCARESDTVARIGGDEFGILLHGEAGPPEVFADRYRAALRPPFALHGHSVRVRASMGVVTPDPHAPLSPDELLRRADSSMYEGKRLGKNAVVLYGHSAGAATDFATELRLADGARPRGYAVVYQPIVRLPDGDPVAIEALSRWTAPNGTQVSPETFVAAAEAAGLGAQFDLLVLDTVCAEIASAGIDLVIHVNIGAARLGDRAFERSVAGILARHRVAPRQLVLEITESVPIVDLADGAASIKRLKATGVRVALDDFGAGYNTLTYLHALPVDMIKLDRALTIGIEPGHDAVLYRSVVGMCEQLGLEVIAEGVETAAQAESILSAGCTVAQGYRFGRPMPLAALPSRRDRPGTSVDAARQGTGSRS